MTIARSMLLCFALLAILFTATGCDRGSTGDLRPTSPAELAERVAPQVTAPVSLSVRIDPIVPNSSIRAGVDTPSIAVKLTSVNVGQTAEPLTVQQQLVPFSVGATTATVTFQAVPTTPTLCEVSLINCSVGSFTMFRGATDVVAGANTVVVNGSGSRLLHDVVAETLTRSINNATLRQAIPIGFVATARETVRSVTRTTAAAYDEAAAMVAVRHLAPPPAPGTSMPSTLTNASLAGVWFLAESDPIRQSRKGLRFVFDGVNRVSWTEIWSSTGSPDSTSQSSTYTVASDGAVTIGNQQRYADGTIFTDGRRLCYVSWSQTDRRVAFGIRMRTAQTVSDLSGTWYELTSDAMQTTAQTYTFSGSAVSLHSLFASSGVLDTDGSTSGVALDADGRLTWTGMASTQIRVTDGDMMLAMGAPDTRGWIAIAHRAVPGLSTGSIGGTWRQIQFTWAGGANANFLRQYTFDGRGAATMTPIRSSDSSSVLQGGSEGYSVPADGSGVGGTTLPCWHTDGRTIIEATTNTNEPQWVRLYLRRP